MASDVLAILVRLSVVGTLGVLLIGPLRAPARRVVGAEAAYWLWLCVPASLVAALLPRPPACLCGPDALLGSLLLRGLGNPLELAPGMLVGDCAPTVTITWGIGATAVLACFLLCQRALSRSLGPLRPWRDGTHRSIAASQPMLIGAWRPRIVLPLDFENLYPQSERTLILAHERAHVDRNDALTNSLGCALVCLFWFNPVVYWAWSRFRFDQELACDAAVLRKSKVPRRHYARALARTQLTAPLAISFGWRRRHSLIERIAILRYPQPGRARRSLGYAVAVLLMLSGAYVVWAAQPDLIGANLSSPAGPP